VKHCTPIQLQEKQTVFFYFKYASFNFCVCVRLWEFVSCKGLLYELMWNIFVTVTD